MIIKKVDPFWMSCTSDHPCLATTTTAIELCDEKDAYDMLDGEGESCENGGDFEPKLRLPKRRFSKKYFFRNFGPHVTWKILFISKLFFFHNS